MRFNDVPDACGHCNDWDVRESTLQTNVSSSLLRVNRLEVLPRRQAERRPCQRRRSPRHTLEARAGSEEVGGCQPRPRRIVE